MASIAVILRDPVTALGLPDQSLMLRHSVDGFASDVYTLLQVDSVTKPGAYKVNGVTTGKYKLWVNGTEDPTFGGDEGVEITEHDDIIIKVVDGDDTYWDGKGHEYKNAGAPTEGTSLIRQDDADARYPQISDLEDYVDLASNQTIPGTKTFNIFKATSLGQDLSAAGYKFVGLVYPGAEFGSAAVPQSWIKDWVESRVAEVEVTPYQNSPNVVRCIPGGVAETNKVYTTYLACLAYAMLVPATSARHITIEFEGMGVAGATEIAMTSYDAGGGPMFIDDFIHLKGKNQAIRLAPPDDTVQVSTLGNTIIENFTVYDHSGSSDTTWRNIIFKDMYFDLVVNSVTFDNCIFRNCQIKVNDDSTPGDATFTNCKGTGTTSNQEIPTTITGWGEKPKADF